jgi:hypothetical protein
MSEAEIREALAAPFPDAAIQWRVITTAGRRALVAPYVDARAVQDRLNDVLGLDGWQDSYRELAGGAVLCVLRIRITAEGVDWIKRSDVGAAPPRRRPGLLGRLFPSRPTAEDAKAACSDALKRAAVKFGVGRYLYSALQVWVDYDPAKRQILNAPKAVAIAGSAAPE